MTAIATAPVMSSHDSGTEAGTEHSPSRFTAVNGKDTSVPLNGANSIPSQQDRVSVGLDARDNSRQDISEHDENSPEDLSSRPSPGTSAHSHKRKRSNSREQESRHPSEPGGTGRNSISHPSELNAPPNSSGVGSGSVSDVEVAPHLHGRSEAPESAQPHSNGSWPEYDSQLVSQAQRAQQIDTSDVQLADALQREAHSQEPNHRNSTRPNPAPTSQPSSSPAYSSERPTTAVQVAPKRKRVFSNRTKTGCMTCRRRKKKCDEQHPSCNNCLRGGFLCEGYSSRSTWQKPTTPKAPVPLQSKEGYPEIGGQYLPEAQHHDRQMTEHMDVRKMRPVVVEEERPVSQYNTSPTETNSAHPTWPKRVWPTPSHQPASYPSEHVDKPDYRGVPLIHELPREAPPKPDYPVVPPIREIPHGPPPKANMPLLFQGSTAPPVPATTTMDTNSPQVQARMALSIENQLSNRTKSNTDTEMDKMIKGELYQPFDLQLMEAKARCRSALARFNNACNPLGGLSSKEQNRLLKEILAPQPSCMLKPPGSPGLSGAMCRPAPSIEPGAIVESPFTCHYGHLSIGEDVMISHDCFFIDDCYIFVGAHTWVGPKVTILTTMAHLSMQERKGTQSRYEGRRVRIMEDCYIGAGCTIYPGVTLGRGAYIAPGEVVRSDVVPYGFQGFKPNYM